MEPAHKPLFTITIPTLGKVDIWMDAIHSVIAQTYPHWEVIAIDSGDESKSRPLIEALGDTRIVYVNTSKGNPRLNWDTGYRHATGQYLLWLDDDNYFLPNALQTLADTIENKGYPDVVTGEHLHYRGPDHYIPSYRNQLVIPLPLFSNGVRSVDSKDIAGRLLGQIQKKPERARFHTSENAVHKRVMDTLIGKIGELNFETTSTHTLRLGMLALSKNVYIVDVPIALIGQSGQAMTDTWPRIDSPVLKAVGNKFELTPLRANTYANYRLENMLRSKKYLGEALEGIEINMPKFVEAYRRELLAYRQPWSEWFKNWQQLTAFIRTQQDPAYAVIKKTMLKYRVMGFIVQCIRTVGLYGGFKMILKNQRVSHNNAKIIPMGPYGADGIRSAAEKLPEAIEKELGVSYQDYVSTKA